MHLSRSAIKEEDEEETAVLLIVVEEEEQSCNTVLQHGCVTENSPSCRSHVG